MANADGKKLGRYVTDSCSATLAEKFTYISDSLDSAQPSPDGDYTFDRVTMYGEDGYDLSGAQNELNAAQNGDMAFTPPVLNAAGDRVILAAKGREGGDVGYIFSANGDLILSTDYETTNPGVNAADDLGFGDIMQQLYRAQPACGWLGPHDVHLQPGCRYGNVCCLWDKAGALFSIF